MNSEPAGNELAPKVPADLQKALASNPVAKTKWKDLTPIAHRDFISWIDDAKQSETRKRRIEVACSKLVAGKRRPCCYSIVPMNLYTALNANLRAKAQWKTLIPDERRDLIYWINSTKDLKTRTQRTEKTCSLLGAGKRHI